MSFDLETTFPTLTNAPISEAIIDLQARLPEDVTLTELREFRDGLEERFTEIQERRSLRARVEFAKDGAPRVIVT